MQWKYVVAAVFSKYSHFAKVRCLYYHSEAEMGRRPVGKVDV